MRGLFLIILSFAILPNLSCYKKDDRADACEKNLTGEYCIFFINNNYSSISTLFYSIEDNSTAQLLLVTNSSPIYSRFNYCTNITVKVSSRKQIVKIRYRVDNSNLSAAPFRIDTIKLCDRTNRIITL